jgi:hypothetical protein
MVHSLSLSKAVANDRTMIKPKTSLPATANIKNLSIDITLDYIGFWQQKALLHFTNSAYKGTFLIAKTVMSILIYRSAHFLFIQQTSCCVLVRHISELKSACAKILIVPGQSETNAEALFYMGYACMRLHDYSAAMEYCKLSYCIDSNRIAIRLLMYDLQIIKKTKTLYKSNRSYTIRR